MYLGVFDRQPLRDELLGARRRGRRRRGRGRPGFRARRRAPHAAGAGLAPDAVLSTHAHFDHAGTAGTFAGDAPVYIPEADASPSTTPRPGVGVRRRRLDPVKDLRTLRRRRRASLAGFRIEVLHTPGHTPGQRVLPHGRDVVVCSGDLVFAGTIGRSDFPNSDPARDVRSLERFLALPDDLRRVARARAGDDRRARARREPVPAGSLAEGLRSRHAGPRTSCRPMSGRMLGLYAGAHALARAVRLPLRRDADLRADGRVRAHVGRHVATW